MIDIVLLVDTDEDLRRFWELRLRALKDAPDAFGASYESESQKPMDELIAKQRGRMSDDNVVFVAMSDDEYVGMVGLRQEPAKKVRHKAMIWGMFVASEHRGKGIGYKLIKQAINHTEQFSGVEQVLLTVVSSNVGARNLYEAMGFEVWGTEKNALKVDGRYYDEDWMVLFLEGH